VKCSEKCRTLNLAAEFWRSRSLRAITW